MDHTEEPGPFVRAFIAVAVNPAVRHSLACLQEALKQSHAHVAWIPPGNMHLTLVFVGNMPTHMVPSLALAVDDAAAESAAFTFEIDGLGFFGSPRSPRVVWAGVTPQPHLMALRARLVERLAAEDITVESRPYAPHLTLGRVRSPRGRDELLSLIRSAARFKAGSTRVDRVLLLHSTLRPEGARHHILHAASLRP